MRLTQPERSGLVLEIVNWIREKMEGIGATQGVIGISGGKDSTVTAALCVKALGSANVHGLMLPNGSQGDLQDGIDICDVLEITHHIIDIQPAYDFFVNQVGRVRGSVSSQTELNIPPRIRMTMLYGYAQSLENAVVINTSNLSEDWVGYATVYGDTAGAFAPLGSLTSDEVVQLGAQLGLEDKFITKLPADGLTGRTDEEVLGFSYEVLNRYIREGIIEDLEVKTKIDRLHRLSRFKFQPIPLFPSNLPIAIEDLAGIYK